MEKSDVVCDVYTDGKLDKSMPEKRVIYTDGKGRYIKSMSNKYYLDANNHWKCEYTTVKCSMSFAEMMEEVRKKNEEAIETYKTNGGMCQHCGKNKAEFPTGLNPFNCKECNAEAQKLVDQLSKDPGFVQIGI